MPEHGKGKKANVVSGASSHKIEAKKMPRNEKYNTINDQRKRKRSDYPNCEVSLDPRQKIQKKTPGETSKEKDKTSTSGRGKYTPKQNPPVPRKEPDSLFEGTTSLSTTESVEYPRWDKRNMYEVYRGRDGKIEDLYIPYDHSGGNQYKVESNLPNSKSTPSPFKHAHAATLGIKVKDITDGKNEVLNFYKCNRNFANGSETDTFNLCAEGLPKQSGDYYPPKEDSEISALQSFTRLNDPLRELQTLRKEFEENRSKYSTFRNFLDSDGEAEKNETVTKFKNSPLFNIINDNSRDEKKLRIKMYMQLSHWYPCGEDYAKISEIKNDYDWLRTKTIDQYYNQRWCEGYLRDTVNTLNDLYNGDIDFRLKAANYGDIEESRLYKDTKNQLWVQPRQTRFSSETSMAGKKLGVSIPYYKKSADSVQQKKDEKWRDKVKGDSEPVEPEIFNNTGNNFYSGNNYNDARNNFYSENNYNNTRNNFYSENNYNNTRNNFYSGNNYNDARSNFYSGNNYNNTRNRSYRKKKIK